MHISGAEWTEIGMIAAGGLGLLVVLAPSLGRKPKQTAEGLLFPVKLTCLLLFWTGFFAGICSVTYAGARLLSSGGAFAGNLGAGDWIGWACFAVGFALVLLVLCGWPEPLIFDQMGISRRGSPRGKLRWRELSHVREYHIGRDHGIVIHTIYGKQLVIADMFYDSARVLEALLAYRSLPLQPADDPSAPISILTAPLPRQ